MFFFFFGLGNVLNELLIRFDFGSWVAVYAAVPHEEIVVDHFDHEDRRLLRDQSETGEACEVSSE